MTPVQSRLLRYLIEYNDQHCCSPSYDEIANAMGFASKSGVARVLYVLADLGWVELPERGPKAHGARGLTILKRPLWLSPYGVPALEHLSPVDLEALAMRIVTVQAGRRAAA